VVIALGALALGLGYAYLGAHNPYVGFQADDALYLLMADIYSPYIDATLPVYAHVKAHSQLPPLFPLLLGMFGAGTDNLAAARLFVAGSMLCAYLLFYAWLRVLALPPRHALSLVAILSILPITLIHVVDIWSEGLYLCFAFLSLIAMRYAEKTNFTIAACLAVGVAVGCAISARTVGVALLPAILLLCYRAKLKGAVVICLSLALFLALNSRLDMGDAGVGYADLLVSRFGEDPFAGLLTQLESSASAAWRGINYDLFQWRDPSTVQNIIVSVLLLLAIVGLSTSIRRAPYAATYLVGYCAIIAMWPFPAIIERLLFVVLPLWAYFAYRGAVSFGARLSSNKTSGGTIFICALLLLAAPSILATARQVFAPFPDKEFESFSTTRYWLDATRQRSGMKELKYLKGLSEAVGDIMNHVPAADCVHTVVPNIVLGQAKRIAWLPLSESQIKTGNFGRCRYFYAIASPASGRRALFPYALMKDQTDIVAVHRYGDAKMRSGDGQLVGLLFARRPQSTTTND